MAKKKSEGNKEQRTRAETRAARDARGALLEIKTVCLLSRYSLLLLFAAHHHRRAGSARDGCGAQLRSTAAVDLTRYPDGGARALRVGGAWALPGQLGRRRGAAPARQKTNSFYLN